MRLLNKINYIKSYKIVIAFIIIISIFIFMYHNTNLYDETIVQVVHVTNSFSHEEEGPNHEIEKFYNQIIIGKVLNGKLKGKKIEITNEYSDSEIHNERYKKWDQLFVSIDDHEKTGIIIQKKRDLYLFLLLSLFLVLLFLVYGKHGFLIIFSLILNITIFLFALIQYDHGKNLVSLSIVMMLLFTSLTLIFSGGIKRKTFVAILASYLTIFICEIIYEVVLHMSERLPYEMMDYVINPSDLSDLFFAGVLMGNLGAIMDVSISIVSGVEELLIKQPNMQLKKLISSIREMGYDIMGTMMNVLLFTYISGALPMMIIKVKNGYTLYHFINFQMVFEIIRFLLGAIGIVLAIPVAGGCSIFIYRIINRKKV